MIIIKCVHLFQHIYYSMRVLKRWAHEQICWKTHVYSICCVLMLTPQLTKTEDLSHSTHSLRRNLVKLALCGPWKSVNFSSGNPKMISYLAILIHIIVVSRGSTELGVVCTQSDRLPLLQSAYNLNGQEKRWEENWGTEFWSDFSKVMQQMSGRPGNRIQVSCLLVWCPAH